MCATKHIKSHSLRFFILILDLNRDSNIAQKCGPDAIQYLQFQKHIILYIAILTVISLTVVLPINFQGEMQGDETTFGHTTLSNLTPK